MDPTYIVTCPCGEEVNVNQMGQYHHNCPHDYNTLHPSCCDDPNVKRVFYFSAEAGTYCSKCGETWNVTFKAYLKAVSSSVITDWSVDRKARPTIYHSNRRIISQFAQEAVETDSLIDNQV